MQFRLCHNYATTFTFTLSFWKALRGVLTAFYLLDEVDSVCSCGLFFLHVDLRVHVNEWVCVCKYLKYEYEEYVASPMKKSEYEHMMQNLCAAKNKKLWLKVDMILVLIQCPTIFMDLWRKLVFLLLNINLIYLTIIYYIISLSIWKNVGRYLCVK